MFLTLEDPRARVKGSRDPLGVQAIWARFGREVVTNLTTVTGSVRGFTILLLGRYLAQRLVEDGRGSEEDAVPIFLRTEQAAAYARHLRHQDEDEARVLGISRVIRFLDEHGHTVPIRNDAGGYILSDQRTYGLWGLYSTAARVSGLLADGPLGLSPWAREFLESQYGRRLRPVESKLLRLARQDGHLDTRRGREPLETLAAVLRPDFSASEVSFYRAALRDAERVERPVAPTHQRQLADLMIRHTDRRHYVGRAEVEQLAQRADRDEASGLATKLRRILRIEASLAPAEALFDLMLARTGQAVVEVAREVDGHWGGHVPHLETRLDALMPDVRLAVTNEQAAAIDRCDRALADGDYAEAVHAILDWNRLVMDGRGAAPGSS